MASFGAVDLSQLLAKRSRPSTELQNLPIIEPVVRSGANTTLTSLQDNILKQAFIGYETVMVESILQSSHTSVATFLIRGRENEPQIVKIGNVSKIRQEVKAYREYVASTLPQNAVLMHRDPIINVDQKVGLLIYRFIGANTTGSLTTLLAYYHSYGGRGVAEVLERIFRIYGRQWWSKGERVRLIVGEDYDRLLPPHLTLKQVTKVPSDAIELQAGKIIGSELANVKSDDILHLKDFLVDSVSPGYVLLQADAPSGKRSIPLRLRLMTDSASDFQPGEIVDRLDVMVTDTRLTSLTHIVRLSLPNFDNNADQFMLEDKRYLNPLKFLPELLETRYEAQISIIHGDLNFQNILVDSNTGFAWLTDFAETRRGPTIFDLVKLEVQIIIRLLPNILARAGLPLSLLVRLLESLHTVFPSPVSPVPELQEPYTILITLRRLVRQYLLNPYDWSDYYVGLTICLISVLDGSEQDPTIFNLALIGSATAIQLIDQALPESSNSLFGASQEEPISGPSPYKGLKYFDVEDANIFFGRELLTETLIENLKYSSFLAVIGASGSGKSSLIRAGLVPALHQRTPVLDDALISTGGESRSLHIITPTSRPLESLAISLTRNADSVITTAALIDDLRRDTRSLHLYARKLVAPGQRLFLIVDQFEELFTICRDQTERKAFVDNLLIAADQDGVTTVVIALRADFYAYCAEFDSLRSALASNQVYIGSMSQGELRRVIEEPARLGGWELESGLVDLLLTDVGNEPGALPLLSHALLETWKRRRGHTLTLTGYTESGRVQGAIAQTAERVFMEYFTPHQQAIAKNIFLRLTELGEGAEDTRRRVQLVELMPKPDEQAESEAVIKMLADARLITTNQNEIEVAHESIIREWPTLQKWLNEDREGLRIHRRLSEAATDWLDLNRDSGALFRGLRLEQTLEWYRNHSTELNSLELEFLEASQVAIQTLDQVEQQREALELRVIELENELKSVIKVPGLNSIKSFISYLFSRQD